MSVRVCMCACVCVCVSELPILRGFTTLFVPSFDDVSLNRKEKKVRKGEIVWMDVYVCDRKCELRKDLNQKKVREKRRNRN